MNVYVIASEGGWCKIGKARDPSSRMSALTTGHPFAISLAHTFPCASDAEAYRIEQAAHVELSQHRMKGEWFAVSVDDAKAAVEKIIAPVCVNILGDCERWMIKPLASTINELAAEQSVLAVAMYTGGMSESDANALSDRLRKIADQLSMAFVDDL